MNTKDNLNKSEESILSVEDFNIIEKKLERLPNDLEKTIFENMWSEEIACRYSKQWTSKLPVVDNSNKAVSINDDLNSVLKIETHNKLCTRRPYKGGSVAAGNVNRTIYAQGIRPVAQLNVMRFAFPEKSETRYLIKNVVKGISDFDRALGVPVVKNNVFFHNNYENKPIVNVMSVGLANKKHIVESKQIREEDPIYLIGTLTGKDIIKESAYEKEELEVAFNEADAYLEKVLMEVSLELAENRIVSGMQNIAKGGLPNSLSKLLKDRELGVSIELDKIPLKDNEMSEDEILLSETQERILVVVKRGKEKQAEEIFAKWEVQAFKIGEINESSNIIVNNKGKEIANLPIQLLSNAPAIIKEYKAPETYFETSERYHIDNIPEPEDLREVAEFMLKHPNLASKNWFHEKFDSMVGTNNMNTNFPSDASLINIKETNSALAISVEGNSRYTKADPAQGAAITVAQAVRKIVCSGGEALALSTCFNMGNPNNPEVYWQFVESINGINEVCRKYDLKVLNNDINFSKHSFEPQETIYPMPAIGVLGKLKDKNLQMTIPFRNKGNMIFLVGESKNDIAASKYLEYYHNVKYSTAPYFSLERANELQKIIRELIERRLICSAHDVSDGGLFMTLLECSMSSGLGFDVTTDAEVRSDAFLFGEAQNRLVISVTQHKETAFIDYMMEKGFPFSTLGHVTKGEMRVDDVSYGFVEEAKEKYENAVSNLLDKKD